MVCLWYWLGSITITNPVGNRSHRQENRQLVGKQMVYTQVRAVFTTYLLTTHLWVVSRQVRKKSNSTNHPGQLGNWDPTENCFLTTYHSSFMVHWWAPVHCGTIQPTQKEEATIQLFGIVQSLNNFFVMGKSMVKKKN